MKSVYSLEFRLLNTSDPAQKDLVEACYRLWRPVWSDTFAELSVQRDLYSEDFLDRELGGLFFNGQPVGFLLWRFFDLSRESHRGHSYFKNYSPELKELVRALGQTMIISYMTIDPAWRKSETDIPVSELLISFSVKRFLESRAENLLGYFRNNRKTNEMFYRHGGIPLQKSTSAYNVDVDFAYITKASAHESTLPAAAAAATELWAEAIQTNNKSHTERHPNDSRKSTAPNEHPDRNLQSHQLERLSDL
ncbi:hypothetical protein [Bdellovibrio bacteriovorus]|uniref:hypothetical protein n=1 Tax=Bdellovibrio bacteriovorus TaxID=959 RepID=UPI003AA9281C